jgi:tRNA(His) guanylyltransferase
MNAAARAVMREFPDVRLGYGESDEYSFLLPPSASLLSRRASKLISLFASAFSSNFVFLWSEHFPDTPLQRPPMFDARAVLYPSEGTVRDYFAWRQVDTHVNNQVGLVRRPQTALVFVCYYNTITTLVIAR